MRIMKKRVLVSALVAGALTVPVVANATYWSLFNVEGESALSAQYVTYGSLTDMLGDTNRLGVFSPNPLGFGTNIVGSGSDGTTYWSLFNVENESTLSAQYVTYGSLPDMLGDTNRLGVFSPNPLGFGANIVGSGSDETTYWSLFNVEDESALSAQYVTYGSLTDMLSDTNRLGVFSPNPLGFGVNIVGSGSDETTYWSLFNVENESTLSAQYVTYGSLTDMLGDTNRLGVFTPNPLGFGVNIVGSGSDEMRGGPVNVTEPNVLALVGLGVFGIAMMRQRFKYQKPSQA